MEGRDGALWVAWRTLRTTVQRARLQLAIDRWAKDPQGAMRLLQYPIDGLLEGIVFAVGGRRAIRRLHQALGENRTVRYDLRASLVRMLQQGSCWTPIRRAAESVIAALPDEPTPPTASHNRSNALGG